jgi:hypothetical protein
LSAKVLKDCEKISFQLASIFLVVSAVKAGILHSSPLAYTAFPAHYSAPLHYSSPYIARSAPLIATNSLYSPSIYHAHATAPLVRSAPIISAHSPVIAAKTILPAAAPIVAAKTILPAAPIVTKAAVVAKAIDEVDVHPQYQYAYSVNDALTGDNKAQEEIRDGDVVKGYYTLLEADGTTRKVSYYGKQIKHILMKFIILSFSADPINGFNAQVTKSAPIIAPAVVEPVAKIVVA